MPVLPSSTRRVLGGPHDLSLGQVPLALGAGDLPPCRARAGRASAHRAARGRHGRGVAARRDHWSPVPRSAVAARAGTVGGNQARDGTAGGAWGAGVEDGVFF